MIVQSMHHIGLVVPVLDEAVQFYSATFGFVEDSRTDWTEFDGAPLGVPGETVRFRWAFMSLGSTRFELHEFDSLPRRKEPRRTADLGLGHLAFAVEDIYGAVEKLSTDGAIEFFSDPNLIEGLPGQDGDLWVYGRDPYGLTFELYQDNQIRDHTTS